MTDRDSPEQLPPLWAPVFWILSLALIAAMIDLMLGIHGAGRGFAPEYLKQFGFPVVGLVVVATATGLFVLWILIGLPLVRLGLRPFATLTSLGIVLAIVGYVAETSDPLRSHNLSGSFVALLRFAVMGIIPAVLAYRLIARGEADGRHPMEAWVGRVAVALTVVASVWWAVRYLLPGGASPVWWALVAGAIVLIAAGARALGGRPWWIVVAVIVSILLAPFAPFPDSAMRLEAKPTRGGGAKVLLLTVDTLRTDVLTPYGASPSQTPNLEALAQDSVLFEDAVSAGSWTLPGTASMLTGLSVAVHEVKRLQTPLADSIDTLAEHLGRAGLVTAAVGGNPHLASPALRFDQGFDRYYFLPMSYGGSFGGTVYNWLRHRDRTSGPSTRWLTETAIGWLQENHDQGFFLWLHYFDPHLGYEPPAEYFPRGQGGGGRIEDSVTVRHLRWIRGGEFVPRLDERKRIRDLYEAEVRYVDHGIGEVLEELKRLGIYDEMVIVFSSDHGEELFDHGGFEHGHTLYNELTSVPLMVKASGSELAGGTRVQQPVATESIVPTVLELLDIGVDPQRFTSRSLVGLSRGERADVGTDTSVEESGELSEGDASERGIDSESGPVIVSEGGLFYESRIALRMGRYKYVVGLVAGREDLYDLEQDPEERYSIVRERPELIARARRELAEHLDHAERLQKALNIVVTEVEISDETRRQLEALGYM